jgi:hypothetical protein
MHVGGASVDHPIQVPGVTRAVRSSRDVTHDHNSSQDIRQADLPLPKSQHILGQLAG